MTGGLAAFVPDGLRAVAVLPPDGPGADLFERWARVVPYTAIGIGRGDCAFVVPPAHPPPRDYAAQARFAVESEAYAIVCTALRAKGVPSVSVDPRALRVPSAVLQPLTPSETRPARAFLDWVSEAPRCIVSAGTAFPLSATGWTIETGDMIRERFAQAPAGEVFCHADLSVWSGQMDLRPGPDDTLRIALSEGRVTAVAGDSLSRQQLVGRSAVEIGFGLNPRVRCHDGPWGEKALGSVHLGFGIADEDDLLPPTIHFDFLLDAPVAANRDLWSVFNGLPVLRVDPALQSEVHPVL